VGINCRNPVPPGATNLVPFLGAARSEPLALAARLLAALEWAMAWAPRPQTVREEARRRLVDLSEAASPRFP
jgi:BirA family biotin operon repressor/biotin-[acetyl-CoA-carboxylase] ligase